ncbi:MAG TPA: diaminopimelate epimerase [Mycobacteriales bacterium]|nr:diaminopimelate epimerase [Mycobacteriales bacterium]
MAGRSVAFVKGHGTENDFIVLPDFDGELDGSVVRALCDRHAGIGADGVLRVTRDDAGYFMEYRNADGSVAETCGNGIRVFARYLEHAGLIGTGPTTIGTRSGPREVVVPPGGGDISVDMGTATRLEDAEVSIGTSSWKASGWSMGNPHLVVVDATPIESLDLSHAPAVDPPSAYPDGVNVELVEPLGERHVRMRVFERGVGETRSCGSGACAAAVAVMDVTGGLRAPYVVDVLGGRLVVDWRGDGTVVMTGPAVLVGAGTVDLDALAAG